MSGDAVYVTGWTFVHFLWEGAVLAAIYAVARTGFRSAGPRLRYGLACLFLSAMAAVAVATAYLQTARADLVVRDRFFTLLSLEADAAGGRILPWLAWFWWAGAGFLSLRAALGAVSLTRLLHTASPAQEEWRRMLTDVMGRLSFRLPVRVLSHRDVDVPMVVGWLKPVVLVPTAALCGLTVQDCESILTHELIHIVRHDYLVSRVQMVIEILLFFHPAVWWISGEIRNEREYCCDDAAAALACGPVAYARTLWRVESLRSRRPTSAIAVDGGDLKTRIHRLVGPRVHAPRKSAGGLILGAVGVLVAVILVIQASAFPRSPETAPEDWLHAARAVAALNDIRDATDLGSFYAALGSRDEAAREEAALTLGLTANMQAGNALNIALIDPSPRVRSAAGQALVAISNRLEGERFKAKLRDTVISGMRTALRDRSSKVRAEAQELLARLDR